MTTLQIRIDLKTKKEAQKLFESRGLDLSSGIKLYLAQLIREKGLPFRPHTINGYTPEFEKKLLRDVAHAEKYGKRYRTVKAAMKGVGL